MDKDIQYYWGEPTSTIDWCEENYAFSPYIAEFINTTTNLSFALLSFFGLYNSIKNNFNKSFIVAHLGVLLVAIGSWCFHMTLQYDMQLLDELPMIYVACIMVWHSIEVYNRKKYGVGLILFLFFYSAFVTYSYIIINNPVFHQVSYAILVISIVYRSTYLVHHLPADLPRYDYIQPRLVQLLKLSASGFIVAFLLWNIDNVFCTYLRQFRTMVPYALGSISQLHGWWHNLTSIGCYYFVVYCEWVHQVLDDQNTDQYELVWVAGFICYLRKLKIDNKKL
ncbi:alkaline ceramidase 3-like protein [Cunninghamella echinulata]|nr:alkaline ceramidase 3-like protein [Cunninghamella echinulata]